MLRFMVNNYETTSEDISNKSGKPNMIYSLWIEIYASLNSSNTEFMKVLFRSCMTNRFQRGKYKFNIEVKSGNIWF